MAMRVLVGLALFLIPGFVLVRASFPHIDALRLLTYGVGCSVGIAILGGCLLGALGLFELTWILALVGAITLCSFGVWLYRLRGTR